MKPARALLTLALASGCALAQENELGEKLYQQAVLLEREGSAIVAVEFYWRAARAGSVSAVRRLEEIFRQQSVDRRRQPLIGDFPTRMEQERDRGIKR